MALLVSFIIKISELTLCTGIRGYKKSLKSLRGHGKCFNYLQSDFYLSYLQRPKMCQTLAQSSVDSIEKKKRKRIKKIFPHFLLLSPHKIKYLSINLCILQIHCGKSYQKLIVYRVVGTFCFSPQVNNTTIVIHHYTSLRAPGLSPYIHEAYHTYPYLDKYQRGICTKTGRDILTA